MTSPIPTDLQQRLSEQIQAYRQQTLLRAQNPEITSDDIARAQQLWHEANAEERPEILSLLD